MAERLVFALVRWDRVARTATWHVVVASPESWTVRVSKSRLEQVPTDWSGSDVAQAVSVKAHLREESVAVCEVRHD